MQDFIPLWVFNACMCMMGIAALLSLYCMLRGPTLADRIISLDAFGICVIGAISMYSLQVDTIDDLSVVLEMAILAFIGLIVVAKYIGGGGDVVDRK